MLRRPCLLATATIIALICGARLAAAQDATVAQDAAVVHDAAGAQDATTVHDAAVVGDAATGTAVHEAPKPPPSADVTLGGRKLCTLRISRGGASAAERARLATRVLEDAVHDGRSQDVGVTFEGATAVLRVGATPLLQLGPEDAAAAGDASVSLHAESCAATIRTGLRTELKRRAIANLVFSLSLVVLSGLVSFLLLGWVSRSAQRVVASVEAHDKIPALMVGTVELLTPAAIRVAASTAIGIAKPIVQVVIVFGWLLGSMSLFTATAELGRRVTGYVLVPVSTSVGRVGASLPLVVLVAIGAFTVAIVLRFLRVFFDNVAQGGIRLTWLTPSQAAPASLVAQVLAVLCSLLVAAPLISGEQWGVLRILGVALTATVVLAMVPSFANAVVGCVTLFTGRYRTDAFVEIGPHSGRVTAIALTHIKIADRSAAEVRVPHLLTLVRPVRVLGDWLPSRYEVVVDARAPQGPIRKALVDAVRRQGQATHVELTDIEGERAVYIVLGMAQEGEEDLASAIADALTRQSLAFSRIRKLDGA